VTLKGVVSSDNGKIAVVTNPANKAYFLREQDPVLNGYVVRITQDSIVFRENVTDRLGKVSQREVVKKVSAPAV
jgi:Tfp pilus assembly protein PilP